VAYWSMSRDFFPCPKIGRSGRAGDCGTGWVLFRPVAAAGDAGGTDTGTAIGIEMACKWNRSLFGDAVLDRAKGCHSGRPVSVAAL
jgi:hypothetical protein